MAVPRCGPSAILMHTAVIAKADMNYCLINKEEVLRIGYPPQKKHALVISGNKLFQRRWEGEVTMGVAIEYCRFGF